MSPMPQGKKLVLVIGATGAQGLAIINALLTPQTTGLPSPYAVRALTRDPASKRAQSLTAKGVECVKGSFMDFVAVKTALQGVYGAFVNTDGFTVSESDEIYAGMRIFELAIQAQSVRHYVWSNLDYVLKISGYQDKYNCPHSDGKGRVGEWIGAQPSVIGDQTMAWSQLTTTPYMDMLNVQMFGPLHIRSDGTRVFASPIGDGRVPLVSLRDIGFFARYIFDNIETTSGKNLEMTSEYVSWPDLVSTFTRVTGHKAVYVRQTLDEWFANFKNVDVPVASQADGGTASWRQDFTGWWNMWKDGVVKRDMEWIRQVNPDGDTIEKWMEEHKYDGIIARELMKGIQDDSHRVYINREQVCSL